MSELRQLKFRWSQRLPQEEAGDVAAAALHRAQRRWRIGAIESRTIQSRRPGEVILELTWSYGPVYGGSINDGRKFIGVVLHEVLGVPTGWARDGTRPTDGRYADVVLVESILIEQLALLPDEDE